MMTIEKKFELLIEYMAMYIQLLPHVIEIGGKRIYKHELPSFEYFKKHYDEVAKPQFKENKSMREGRIVNEYAHGLGYDHPGIAAYRYYNSWMGCKYFTGKNIDGNFTIHTNNLNELLKKLK